MKKLALAYGFNQEKRNTIQTVGDQYQIEIRFLNTADLNQKVGKLMELTGAPGEEEESLEYNETEFMIFSDFDRQILRSFTLDLREKGVPTPYKSVLTPTNRQWRLGDLIAHIEEEHRTMMKFNQLGRAVKKAQDRYRDGGRRDEELLRAIEDCLEVPNQEISEELLDEKITMMEELLRKES